MRLTIEVDDNDAAAIEHDIIDLKDWVEMAVKGKANNCRKRMDTEWRGRLDADPAVQSVPAGIKARIAFIRARPDYRTRAQRG